MIRSWVVADLARMEEHRRYMEAHGTGLPEWRAEVYTRIDLYKRLLTEGFHDDEHAVTAPTPETRRLPTTSAYDAGRPYPAGYRPRFVPPHGIRREGY